MKVYARKIVEYIENNNLSILSYYDYDFFELERKENIDILYMINIQIFVVFHKNIFDDCYKNIPDDILQEYFTFIGVNEKIPKNYTDNKYKVINEWELPIYDPTFQERGYNENSVLYHVYANNLHKYYEYVGFFQYDMAFCDNIIDFLEKNITTTPTLFGCMIESFSFCSYDTWNEPRTLDYVVNDYETFYNRPFNKESSFPLLNSYVISTDIYEKIMKWIIQLYDKLYPWCIQPPNRTHFGHIGGIYERIMAYALGQEYSHYISLNISHDQQHYKRLSY
jgi:hypothetical protein